MTTLQLTIVSILFQHHKSLLAPVLQHLAHGVVVHTCALDGYRVLHGLLEGELHVEAFVDGVVLSAFYAFSANVSFKV